MEGLQGVVGGVGTPGGGQTALNRPSRALPPSNWSPPSLWRLFLWSLVAKSACQFLICIFQCHSPHLMKSLRKHFYITYIPICTFRTSRPKYKGLVEKLQRLSTASDLLGPQRDNSYSGFLCPAAGLPMVKVPLFSLGKLDWTLHIPRCQEFSLHLKMNKRMISLSAFGAK